MPMQPSAHASAHAAFCPCSLLTPVRQLRGSQQPSACAAPWGAAAERLPDNVPAGRHPPRACGRPCHAGRRVQGREGRVPTAAAVRGQPPQRGAAPPPPTPHPRAPRPAGVRAGVPRGSVWGVPAAGRARVPVWQGRAGGPEVHGEGGHVRRHVREGAAVREAHVPREVGGAGGSWHGGCRGCGQCWEAFGPGLLQLPESHAQGKPPRAPIELPPFPSPAPPLLLPPSSHPSPASS